MTVQYDGQDTWGHYSSGGLFVTHSPTYSEKEDLLALASPVTGNGDIYAVDVLSQRSERVTSSPECDLSPHIRPKSRQLVFLREEVPYGHLWLVDLDTGQERRLTAGHQYDVLLDLSADGEYLLFLRRGVVHLLRIDNCRVKKLPAFSYAKFLNNQKHILGTTSGPVMTVASADYNGAIQRKWCQGRLVDVNEAAGVVVIIPVRSVAPTPDGDRLQCIDIATGKRHLIGVGAYPTVFSNGKIIYFCGFARQAWIWDAGSGVARQIDSPAGYKYRPQRSGVGNMATVYVMPPDAGIGRDRELHIYLFDANTEAFQRLNVSPPVK